MALTLATELADYASGIGTQGATLKIDADNKRVGVGTTNPQGPEGTLQVGTGITFFGNTGIISAIGGKFSGDFIVGGTLTYEDVQNVNSSGVGTFSGGINVVGGGLTVTGVSTFFSRVSIADSIVHTGDIDTSLRFPAADTFSVETGGAERLRVDSSGRLLVGSDTTITDDNFGIGNLQVTDKTGFQHVLFSGHSASASNATALSLGRSRGTQASPGYLSSGDHIARFSAISYNGGNYGSSGCIDFFAGDQHASNDLPGYIALKTVPDGSATLTERLRITSAGLVGINTTTPTENLSVNGNVVFGHDQPAGNPGSTIGVTTVRGHHVNSDGDYAELYFANSKSSGGSTASIRAGREGDNAGTNLTFYTQQSGGSAGNGTERLRITSAGITTIASGSFAIPSVPEANTDNTELPVLFQTTAGTIDGGSGLTYNPAGDSFSVNGLILSSQIVRTSGSNTLTLTTANGNGQSDVRVTTSSVQLFGGSSEKLAVTVGGVNITGITTATQLFEGTNRVATAGKAVAMALVFG